MFFCLSSIIINFSKHELPSGLYELSNILLLTFVIFVEPNEDDELSIGTSSQNFYNDIGLKCLSSFYSLPHPKRKKKPKLIKMWSRLNWELKAILHEIKDIVFLKVLSSQLLRLVPVVCTLHVKLLFIYLGVVLVREKSQLIRIIECEMGLI